MIALKLKPAENVSVISEAGWMSVVHCRYIVKFLWMFTYWWMCPWLCPPVFWLQSHRAERKYQLLHSLLQDEKRYEQQMFHFKWERKNKIKRMMQYHTNEVVLQFIQHWLHVLTGQALGPYQALQHSEHATNATTLFGAEINTERWALL